jgi:hypothetical protein
MVAVRRLDDRRGTRRPEQKDGAIVYRFHARDVHLVLGPAPGGEPIRFHVTIDGAPPGENHGADVDAAGDGTVTEQRLYQLVRQNGTITDRTFEIRFLVISACRLTPLPSAETGTPPCLSLFQVSRPDIERAVGAAMLIVGSLLLAGYGLRSHHCILGGKRVSSRPLNR